MGDTACSNLNLLTPKADINISCQGTETCKSLYAQSLAISMECIGDKTCTESYITGTGDLLLDCSSDGTNTCSSMTITMRASLFDSNNTILCGNSHLNSSYSCYKSTLTSSVRNIEYVCGKNYGCYGQKIRIPNPTTKVDMQCLHDNAC